MFALLHISTNCGFKIYYNSIVPHFSSLKGGEKMFDMLKLMMKVYALKLFYEIFKGLDN